MRGPKTVTLEDGPRMRGPYANVGGLSKNHVGHLKRVRNYMASSKSSRRLARRKAFELLFELQQHPGMDASKVLARSFGDPDVLEVYSEDEDADGYVVVPVRRTPEGAISVAPQAEGIRHFVSELVMAVTTYTKQIDDELSKYPEDWSYDRIGTAERIL